MSPVEVFATTIKIFDWQKTVLDRLIVPSEALDHLIFKGQRSKLQPHTLDLLVLAAWRSP